MALINKPDYSEIWASGGSIVEPSDVKKQTGWTAEVPPYQWENWIQNRQDQMLAHINQHGIAVWDAETEYQSGKSYVQGSNGLIYVALQTHTNQNPVTDVSNVYWFPYQQHGIISFAVAGVTNWAVPLAMQIGIIKPKVTVVGGGGGGGGNNNSAVRAPGGGGAGGASIKIVDLTGVTSVSITVGAAGAGGTTSAGTGGGTSSFGAYNSATGGSGGSAGVSSGAGGDGGTGIGGDFNLKGGDGASARAPDSTNNNLNWGGDGGPSIFGGSCRGGTNVSSTAGTGAGGGANAAGSGRPGGVGMVIIEW
jgi:hypothetical protein